MRLLITRYKSTGKYYDELSIIAPESTYLDNTALKIVRETEPIKKWDGYITIHEVQADGFELPIRLLTNSELK